MDDFNNPYAFQRSPSNGDDMITLRNKPIEAVTVPSQRHHHPTSSLSSTTASSSSMSSFTNFPPLPSYSTTMQQDYYQQQSWDDPLPPPPPPTSNHQTIHSHQRHRWSPESSSHPYHYPHRQIRKHEIIDDEVTTHTKERRHRKQPHELLSESQKKANHIVSEQKRRQNIRIGFDQLIDIVPSLNHGNRSEALILQKSVDHIRHLIVMKNELKNQVRDLQGTLGDTNYEEDSSEDEQLYSY